MSTATGTNRNHVLAATGSQEAVPERTVGVRTE